MSAYNEVVPSEEEVCERCASRIRRPIQFKFGDTWQHEFGIGSKISWGGNDFGEPGHRRVVVMGYPGECPVCGFVPDRVYDVTIEDDVIMDVRPSTGSFDYAGAGRTYFIVEP